MGVSSYPFSSLRGRFADLSLVQPPGPGRAALGVALDMERK
jgi:hypothetical protein